jgi:hypothetical protein
MRLLAIAKPNPAYTHYECIKNIILNAYLVNNQIQYFETQPEFDKTHNIKLSEWAVHDLFNDFERNIKDIPFLFRHNIDFGIIIKRDKSESAHNAFLQLKNKR